MNQGPKIKLFTELSGLCKKAGGLEAARHDVLASVKKYYQNQYDKLGEKILERPQFAALQRQEFARLTDDVLVALFEVTRQFSFDGKGLSDDIRIALIAVGGYGRYEMAPFSDIDLLFVVPSKVNKEVDKAIETLLYLLWDVGFKVGQSVRSIQECLAQAEADITIRTALLEQRFLAGDAGLSQELVSLLRSKLFDRTLNEFIEAKMDEREKRHDKSGNIRYVLEPNVKEAKGGLRDLQTLFWLGKYITGAGTPEEMMQLGLFQPEELQSFREAEEFLWNVRMILHILTKRGNDLLSFDMQVEVARVLGYADGHGRRGVEKFMQDYFRAARQVGELTRVFLTELEARHVWRSGFGGIRDIFKSNLSLPSGFRFQHGRVTFDNENVIVQNPMNILRIFKIALETHRLIHPNAFRWMARHHSLIDDEFRSSKEANHIFLSLILDHQNPERALRRMNEIGLLGQFIPDWAKIDAMMQFNMYHSYTVDEHTIQCLSILSDIEKGLFKEDLPIVSGILQRGVNRRVLYLALMFHDIGKGQERPHEIVGEEVARVLAARMGLDDYEVELVAWLVRSHLQMSDAAQKKDLSDPKTITDFAKIVSDQERLDLLTVLTVCDIRGVGPTTWNNWKAMLLRELYGLTRDTLGADGKVSGLESRVKKAKEVIRQRIRFWGEEEIERELGRHYPDYWLGLSSDVQMELAELLRLQKGDEACIRFATDEARDATRIAFVMPDHPGLFARICGAVSLSGADIVDARTYTSSDGMATAIFWVQDRNGKCYGASRQEVLQHNVMKVLHGDVIARTALAERQKIKKRERQFQVSTKISFDNDGSRFFTIIQIETRNRMGLLHDITRSLAAANISISSAIIATYGEEAVDSFYVKDLFGLKIHSETKQKTIAEKLKGSIERGYQEAIS